MKANQEDVLSGRSPSAVLPDGHGLDSNVASPNKYINTLCPEGQEY